MPNLHASISAIIAGHIATMESNLKTEIAATTQRGWISSILSLEQVMCDGISNWGEDLEGKIKSEFGLLRRDVASVRSELDASPNFQARSRSLDDFALFPKLPVELRLKIWKMASSTTQPW